MTPEGAVAARLLDISAVTAIVSTRVYVGKAPQRPTLPLVLVQRVVELTDYHLRGEHRDRARVQVDAYVSDSGSDPYGYVAALADAINGDGAGSGLSGWVGIVGSPGFEITGVLRVDRRPEYEPDELKLWRERQDYRVFFKV